MPLLEIEDLSVGFHTERGLARVVDDLSFTIDAGRIVGLVGEFGCGKSVTARAIMRLLPCPPAQIEGRRLALDGEDLLALDERAMRDVRGNRIGMIFQEPMTSLNPTFPVGFQIGETLRLHRSMGGARSARGCSSCCAWSASARRSGASRSIRTSSRAACASAS